MAKAILLAVAGVLFAAAPALMFARPASAFEMTQAIPGTDETACVDVADNDTADGTPVIAYPCNGGFNEQWNMVSSYIRGIGTDKAGGKCLASPSNDGGPVTLGSCDQYWFWDGVNLFYGTGGCLDSQGKYGPKAQVAMTDCRNLASQKWAIKDIVIEQSTQSDVSACVDVRGNAIANHTPVEAYPCTLGANEKWNFVNGELQGIGTTKGVAMCLGETAAGYVELQTCTGASSQLWVIGYGEVSGGPVGVSFLNMSTSRCLDSRGEVNGTQLMDTTCNNPNLLSTGQRWTLH
jgi:hypothetical protein